MDELFLLYKLHQVDWAIYQIRQKAHKLENPSAIVQLYQETKQKTEPFLIKYQELQKEYKDLTLKQETLEARQKTIEKELYSVGTTTREIETLQKELKNIKSQIEENDTTLLQMLEDLPQLEKEAEEAQKPLLELGKKVKEQYTLDLQTKDTLQSKFQKLQAIRPEIAQKVPTPLLNEYQTLLKRLNGIAMAEITPQNTCQACGTRVAERLLENCKQGKKVHCESCKRILYTHSLPL